MCPKVAVSVQFAPSGAKLRLAETILPDLSSGSARDLEQTPIAFQQPYLTK